MSSEQLFQHMNRNGRTVVLITHDMYVAEHANRIISLHDGRVVGDERVKSPRQIAGGEW